MGGVPGGINGLSGFVQSKQGPAAADSVHDQKQQLVFDAANLQTSKNSVPTARTAAAS